ncbi:triple tyrosine motif-containing protein [Sulfobacillus thermosulfidooxidans]|uniref:triple tyrosine motif-containing protein n=1 Tax=Sulfobacillus thermosulfidooxidans TaxID=28034 RepID=UPI0002F25CB4|nr:triple tyrosine motif-containing protein [Sulfobacillus thermosulfidooxidans]
MKILVSSIVASATLLSPLFSSLVAHASTSATYATTWNKLRPSLLPPTPFYQSELGELKQLGHNPGSHNLTVVVDSAQRIKALKAYANAVNTPGSPLFHHFLSPQQLDSQFGPTPSLLAQAQMAIKDAGWKIISKSPFTFNVMTNTSTALKIPVSNAIYAVEGLNPVHIVPAAPVTTKTSHFFKSPESHVSFRVNAAIPGSLAAYNFRQQPTQVQTSTASNGDILTVISFNPDITKALPSGLPFNLIITAQSPSGTPLAIKSVQSISDSLNNLGYYGNGQPFPGSNGTLWQLELVAFGPSQQTDTLSAQVTLDNGTQATISFPLPTFTGSATALFPLTGAQISQLLGANTLYQSAFKQSPAPVAIFTIGQAPNLTDLSTLMNQESLPMPHVHITYEDGAPSNATDSQTAVESNLDIQAVSSVAPGATIEDDIYPSNDSTDPLLSFLTMLSQQNTIKIATVSYGFFGENTSALSTLVDACTAEGITLIFASGDQGAYAAPGGQLGLPSADSQPGVLTVGGLNVAATATFDNTGKMTSLSGPTVLKAWGGDYLNGLPLSVLNAYLQQNAASTGGFGTNPVPTWQANLLPTSANGIGVPDIASLAGMPAMLGINNGQSIQFGGTSLAAPLTAGWLADLESLNHVQNSGMGNINPLLFQAANTHPSDFLQAQWGSNGYYQVTSSEPGSWNPVTGLGAPEWDQLAALWHPQAVTHLSLSSITSTASVGTQVPFTLTALTASGNPDPYFTGPIQITSSDPSAELPNSSQVRFFNGQAVFTVIFGSVGQQTITVSDPNQSSLQVTSTPITVTNPISLTVTNSTIVGQPVNIDANTAVSSANLRYQFWVKDPANNTWRSLGIYSSVNHAQFTPNVPGIYEIQVFVKGLTATTQTATATVMVQTPSHVPMVSGLSVSSPTIFQKVGATVTFSASAVDPQGTPLYQFWVHGPNNRWSMVQNYSSDSQLTLKNLKAGSYVVAVYALDTQQYRQHAFDQAYYYTTVLNVGSSVHLTLPDNATIGQSIDIEANASGLTDPVYQFWIKSPSGQWSQSGAYGTNQYQFTPNQSGNYTIVVYAKDPDAPATSQFAVIASQIISVS